ncbi:MAG: hypothetical protein HY290_05520, partial [Planctomycetia bacterium]|nr:hypothetical protein [Planctomycetia bacterium]
MPRRFINTLSDGETIEEIFLLSEKQLRANRNAALYLLVELRDKTGAIGARMYILDRPPIINLYSTAIFIGWGCLLLGLIIELIFRNSIGNVVGAVAGALTCVVAHN